MKMQKIKQRIRRLLPWQKKKALPSVSTETEQEPFKLLEQNSLPATPLSPMFHQGCKTLKYDRFLDVMLTGNVSLLIIAGQPEPNDLYLAWQQILQDYAELIQTPKSKNIFELWLRVISTQNKMTFIQVALRYLRAGYDAEIANSVSEAGYGTIEPLEDRWQYLQQVDAVEEEAKILIVLFNQYANEYNLLCPEDKSKPKIERTRMDYEKELAVLSKFNGFRLRAEDITVFEFCSYVNTYIETMKHGTTV